MKYPLEPNRSIPEDLLFWGKRWIRFKIMTLSTSNVSEEKILERILKKISRVKNIEELGDEVKNLRKIGLSGVNVYFVTFSKFYSWIEDNVPENIQITSIREISTETLMEFLTVTTAGKSDATKKNYRNTIGNYFKYISMSNFISETDDTTFNFSINISSWQGLRGTSGTKAPEHLTREELAKLLERVDTAGEYRREEELAFYSLLIRIIAYSGLRISEVLKMERKDIVLKDSLFTLRIKGKGNKERFVFIEEVLIRGSFDRWQRVSPCIQTRLLFCSMLRNDEPASASSISHKISTLLRKEGILTKKTGAHLLRHTYATLVYGETGDLVLVQKLLGHASTTTTEIYTHVNEEKKKSASSMFIQT